MQRDRHNIARLSDKEKERRALALKVLLGLDSDDIKVEYDPEGGLKFDEYGSEKKKEDAGAVQLVDDWKKDFVDPMRMVAYYFTSFSDGRRKFAELFYIKTGQEWDAIV